MMTTTAETTVDLLDPEDIVDAILARHALAMAYEVPWRLYGVLRSLGPAYRSERYGMWVLTGFDGCLAALRNPRSDLGRQVRADAAKGSFNAMKKASTMLYLEDPAHTLRQRRLVAKAFTPQTVQHMKDFTRQRVGELLADLAGRSRFDFFDEFADHIPVAVICQMLGVPREDVPIFREWTRMMAPSTAAVIDHSRTAQIEEAVRGLHDYYADLIPRHREKGTDDLLGRMIRAHEEGDRLSEMELISLSTFLLSAGSDTTSQAMTAIVRLWAAHPAQYEEIRRDRALLGNAIEEAMRHSGPVHYAQPRYLREPLELDGLTIGVGETVLPIVAGAHRDPDHFDDPDTFDIRRADTRHLGFSQGMHMCLGAPLARLELSTALGMVLDEFASVTVTQDPVPYVDLGPMRGISAMGVEVTR